MTEVWIKVGYIVQFHYIARNVSDANAEDLWVLMGKPSPHCAWLHRTDQTTSSQCHEGRGPSGRLSGWQPDWTGRPQFSTLPFCRAHWNLRMDLLLHLKQTRQKQPRRDPAWPATGREPWISLLPFPHLCFHAWNESKFSSVSNILWNALGKLTTVTLRCYFMIP